MFEVEVEPHPHWDAPSVQKIGTQTIKYRNEQLLLLDIEMNHLKIRHNVNSTLLQ